MLGAVALLGVAVPGAPPSAPAPRGELAVKLDDGWRVWWRSDAAPTRWPAPHPLVAGAVRWREAHPGLEWGTLRLAGGGEAWRLAVVLVRLDPARYRLRVDVAPRPGGRIGPWTVDAAPDEAVLALNAGQFDERGPWGWVVQDGVERRPPGGGTLAPAIVVDSAGTVRLVPPDSIAAVRAAGGVAEAFQSYPTLLADDGALPAPLLAPGAGVDLAHRDGRLALGVLRDGRVLVALTRFVAPDGVLSVVPVGPTVPEMAALMGALGCARAVLLDGGISGQLALRDSTGRAHRWRGLRRVPMGLVAVPREGT